MRLKKSIFICFSISQGSMSEYYISICNKLSQHYQVYIISDRKNKSILINKNIEIFFWPSKRPTRFRDYIFYKKLLKLYKPVMTIASFGSVNISLIASFFYGVKYRIAWIHTLSTQLDHRFFLKFRKKIFYKFSNLIITNSHATAIDTNEYYNINKNKIEVLPYAVKDYIENFNDIKVDLNKIVYAGRLHHTKGIDVLIKAFSKIQTKYNNLSLVVIGSGPESDNLFKLTKTLGLENKVIFKGKVLKNEVLKKMKSSFITVVPSHTEAFGFTVIEAMSMKTCVIGADNTGIAEIIKHNKTGLLFKTADANDLAEKLDIVLKNPKMRNRLAVDGYKHFKLNYSTESAVKRDAEYFRNLIENS